MSLFKKLFALILSAFYLFHAPMAPAKNDPIRPSSSSRLNVVLWADTQVSNYMLEREPYFTAACDDVRNSGVVFDALLVAGDVAENGLAVEYDYISEKLPVDHFRNFLMAVGNHDVRLRVYKQTVRRFTSFTNDLNRRAGSSLVIDALHYKCVLKGYTFLVLGTDRTEFEESYFSPAQMQWLDDELRTAAKGGKPVFVTVHQTFKDVHGLPGTWNSPIDAAGSIGRQSDELRALLAKYKNVILLTGHLHTGIGQYTYEVIDGIHSVNLPSLTIDNKDGRVDGGGLGFWMEVFGKKVVFHARDFSAGKNIPQEDFTIRLK